MGKHASLRGLAVGATALLMTVTGAATSASANPRVGNISYGMSGPGVKCVQIAVNNYYGKKMQGAFAIDMDGVFGPATLRGVKDFQGGNANLDVDGIVGPQTGNRMVDWWLGGEVEGSDKDFCSSVLPTTR
ncbi:peptidoglycan-binding protein [Kitasatospora sp. NPDC018058]|uniref:peptidoglycan-binding protein n=1 Tax=Kitasatospora sp. NPDC018058 TaxID=3364025 RepID=UPI0037BE8310